MPTPAPATPPPRTILVIDTTAVTTESGAVGTAAQFSTPTIEALRAQGHRVHILTYVPPAEVLNQADVVWSEWCNEAAYELAAGGHCRRLVIRVRGFDAWTPLNKMQWSNVHAVVHESTYLQKVFKETLAHLEGALPPTVQQHVIPAGINLTRFPFIAPPLNTPKAVVAVLTRAIPWKGQQLVYEWAHQMPDVEIHMTTALGEYDDRFMRYLEFAKPSNVHLHGTVDAPKWLHEIGAQFLLSASMCETLSYSTVEGLATGLVPLIHAAPDNTINWPQLPTWKTLKELSTLLRATLTRPPAELQQQRIDARAFVEANFDSAKQTAKFAEVLFDGLDDVPAPPTLELTPIVGNEAEVIAALLDGDSLPQAIQVLQRWNAAAADVTAYAGLALRTAKMAHTEGEHAVSARIALRALEQDPTLASDVFELLARTAEARGAKDVATQWYLLGSRSTPPAKE